MLIRIKENEIKYIFACIGLFLCLEIWMQILISSNTNISAMIRYLSIITIIELCFFIGISSLIDGSILNFANLFISILWLFNFGQLFLVGFNITDNLTIYLNYFSGIQNYEVFKDINYAFAAICIGALYGQGFRRKNYLASKSNCQNYKYLSEMKKKAILLIAVTFPLKIMIDIPTLLIGLTQNSNMANIWQNSIPDVIVTYGNISIIGMGLLIIALREEKMKQKYVFIFFALYIVAMMMGGKRSENVAYICILFLVFIKSRGIKINLKKVIVYFILVYLLLTTLITIVYARQYVDERNIRTLSETFWKCLTTKNMFISSCRDYGTTGYTAECVITYWLPKYGATHGLSYIGGLASVFPNIGDIFGRINRNTAFALLMQQYNTLDSRYFNIGGSMIGELFFNFGIMGGICGAYIIGNIVGIISRKVSGYLAGQIDFRIVYYIALMSAVTYWIRDYFGGISREIVWSFLVCWIISRVKIKE